MSELAAELAGKVAVVTGATEGIGEHIARGLLAAGAKVMITGINDAAGSALAASLGDQAAYRHMDVTLDADLDACLDQIKTTWGKLDIIVNCACSYLDSGLATPRAHWLACLDVNVVGPAVLVNKALPIMTQPGGVVINIGSVSGKFGMAKRGPYSAGKAALMHFTKTACAALGPVGIRVLTVSPAWTWSPPMEAMTNGDRDRADRGGAAMHPLGRVGRMQEIANVVVFAASDKASWVNGCDLAVDGGFSSLGPDQGRGPAYWTAQA